MKRTYEVHHGDTPWGIARRFTGVGAFWPQLIKANPNKLTVPCDPLNPDSIRTFASLEPRETILLPDAWFSEGLTENVTAAMGALADREASAAVATSAARHVAPIDDDEGGAWATPSWEEP